MPEDRASDKASNTGKLLKSPDLDATRRMFARRSRACCRGSWALGFALADLVVCSFSGRNRQPLFLLDDAHSPGRFQAVAEFTCWLRSSKRANVDAIEHPALTKIDAMNDWV
jgi:hypothetical protein